MKFENIKAGDVLYDVHRQKMGNTTLSSMGVWTVKIIEVNEFGATVSWNGNRPEKWGIKRLRKLRVKRPELVAIGFGRYRLKRRGE